MKKIYLLALSAALCTSAFAQVNVTFEVDMNGQTVNPDGVHLAGNFNDPNGDGNADNPAYLNWTPNAIMLDDSDMDGIYSVTLQLVDARYEFKFINDNDWPGAEDVPPTCQVEATGNDNRETWVAGTDYTYHVVFGSCGPQGMNTIRFRVDMSLEAAISPDGIHVAGQFQGWDPAASELNEKAPGIYEGYFTYDPIAAQIPNGTDVEYKFINGDDWTENSIAENVIGDCAVPGGNRLVVTSETNTLLPVFCFNACSPCVAPTTINFELDMSNETVSANGVHAAGSFQGWSAGDSNWELTDGNSDGIYTLTVAVQPGIYLYKFINGNDWSGAGNDNESLPAECNVGGNRELVVGTEALDVAYCYNQCAALCVPDPDPASITFRVNTDEMDPQPVSMFLIGNFTDPQWQGGAVTLTDADSDGVYEATILVDGPAEIQYKFVKDDVNEPVNEENAGVADCGVANGIGGFNRVHVRTGEAEVLSTVCFNVCVDCVINVTEIENLNNVSIFPVPAQNTLNVSLNSLVNQKIEIRLINALGQTAYSLPLGTVNGQIIKTMDVSSLSSGVYTLAFITDSGSFTRLIEIK
ncbi:MAG: T9SS type A sorting domain-containing protein [Flavobacteriales bacterium]|nr:T9SS type A sorting domain-containing protein [Flavobacteriales bacterium]